MAKTNFSTHWVPQAGVDMAALRRMHQRTFPGNELCVQHGLVKIAVADGEAAPKDAILTAAAKTEWAKIPAPTGNGRV